MERYVHYKKFREEAAPLLAEVIRKQPDKVDGLAILESSHPESGWHRIITSPDGFRLETTYSYEKPQIEPKEGFFTPEEVAKAALSRMICDNSKEHFIKCVKERTGVDLGEIVRNHVFGQET